MSWLVLGSGKSGIGAALLLKELKLDVLVVDEKIISSETKALFDDHSIQYAEKVVDLEIATKNKGIISCVISPGIPPTHNWVIFCQYKGIQIFSDIEIAAKHWPGKIFGVTGTNGKSTTVTYLQQLLTGLHHKAIAAGNIGQSACETVFNIMVNKDTEKYRQAYLVLELSSYQLHYSTKLKLDAAIITNMGSDHLDWHGSVDHYIKSKLKIVQFTEPKGLVVLDKSAQSCLATHMKSSPLPTIIEMGQHINSQGEFLVDEVKLNLTPPVFNSPGRHNKMNITAALLLVHNRIGFKIDNLDLVKKALSKIYGLSHRYELVEISGDLQAINDSKATNLEATITAIECTNSNSIYLLLGGRSKGESFKPLEKYAKLIKKSYLFGESKDEILDQIGDIIQTETFNTLHDFFRFFPSNLKKTSGVLLFSPGCASFDEFRNFEERGDFFKAKIKEVFRNPKN